MVQGGEDKMDHQLYERVKRTAADRSRTQSVDTVHWTAISWRGRIRTLPLGMNIGFGAGSWIPLISVGATEAEAGVSFNL